MAVYFTANLAFRGTWMRYLVLNAAVYLAFIVFYNLLVSGVIRPIGVVFLMFAGAVAVLGYDSRSAILSGQWPAYFYLLPDFTMLFGGLLTALAIRPPSGRAVSSHLGRPQRRPPGSHLAAHVGGGALYHGQPQTVPATLSAMSWKSPTWSSTSGRSAGRG